MNNLSKVTLVTLIGFAILPVASPQPGASPKTFRESVYTAEQADRGAQIYMAGKILRRARAGPSRNRGLNRYSFARYRSN